MAQTDPVRPRKRKPPSRPWRRFDAALGQLNPMLVSVAMGLVILNLTCLAALLLPAGHLSACVTLPEPIPATAAAKPRQGG